LSAKVNFTELKPQEGNQNLKSILLTLHFDSILGKTGKTVVTVTDE
jgi:hypothetical protein